MSQIHNTGGVISIHSLIKRETLALAATSDEGIISIHSLVKRETPEQPLQSLTKTISIHSLVKRETLLRYIPE